ncbi:hypothetical protein TIFTF001_035752 [Ficus carica]|uniref:Uncharacterized protein n=1 Tax=Ficus carica TaxID=3494 RepID=A0AA88J9Z1_FICCA|nr:hypothetical protein TIFTF001_035752 [Ficus carica]
MPLERTRYRRRTCRRCRQNEATPLHARSRHRAFRIETHVRTSSPSAERAPHEAGFYFSGVSIRRRRKDRLLMELGISVRAELRRTTKFAIHSGAATLTVARSAGNGYCVFENRAECGGGGRAMAAAAVVAMVGEI